MSEEVEAVKAEYPPGTRVRFLGFGEPDPYTQLVVGTIGIVKMVDDSGTVHVDWTGGGSLGMVLVPESMMGRDVAPDRIVKL